LVKILLARRQLGTRNLSATRAPPTQNQVGVSHKLLDSIPAEGGSSNPSRSIVIKNCRTNLADSSSKPFNFDLFFNNFKLMTGSILTTMISNTSTVPILHGGFISLDTIKAKTDVSKRRVKIVCTLGPACWSEEGLAALMDCGMNVARFNCEFCCGCVSVMSARTFP
jgi:hypothetical protein